MNDGLAHKSFTGNKLAIWKKKYLLDFYLKLFPR